METTNRNEIVWASLGCYSSEFFTRENAEYCVSVAARNHGYGYAAMGEARRARVALGKGRYHEACRLSLDSLAYSVGDTHPAYARVRERVPVIGTKATAPAASA